MGELFFSIKLSELKWRKSMNTVLCDVSESEWPRYMSISAVCQMWDKSQSKIKLLRRIEMIVSLCMENMWVIYGSNRHTLTVKNDASSALLPIRIVPKRSPKLNKNKITQLELPTAINGCITSLSYQYHFLSIIFSSSREVWCCFVNCNQNRIEGYLFSW